MITEVVYLGHDNTIDLLLKEDGTAISLSSVTKMELQSGSDIDISSEDSPNPFDWTPNPAVTGKVIISLGACSLSEGYYETTLIVTDNSNPNGIVWGNFYLKVE